jgi:hypothetical protein
LSYFNPALPYGGYSFVFKGTFSLDSRHWSAEGEGYDPATKTWDQSLPRMRIPRHGFAGAVIGDQLHVVAGDIQTAGIPGVTANTDTHDVFDFTK